MTLDTYHRDGYDLKVTEEGGFIFLHIFLEKITKSTITDLRALVTELKDRFKNEGHDVVFATTPDKRILKMWKMIEPCYEIVQLKDAGWLGSWLTEEI